MEARALAGALGKGSEARVGVEASEAGLKSASLESYRVVHFATHAVVDAKHPERSAVVLHAGSEDEDGLLQMREIVDLELRGALVLLSACESGAGETLAGEGALSLAHAFFQAGARTVVAGLGPLRDDETARLVSEMAERLGRGESAGDALAGAQRALIAEGAPAAAWSGLVLLGDHTLRVAEPARIPRGAGLLALLAAVVLAVVVLRRRRKTGTG